MGTTELTRFVSEEALAEAAAKRWLDDLRARSQARYCTALPGGRIAAKFFAAVVRRGRDQRSSFASLHFFWGDERVVPPDSSESNFALAKENLLVPLGIPEPQIHRVRGELSSDLAAIRAGADVRQVVSMDAHGTPVFDLIFLGMGEDGHVASLFPDAVKTAEPNGTIYLPVVSPKPPPHRVTLTYRALAAARQVWVLASGEGKEEALKESLRPEGTTPLAKLIRLREKTLVFTDIPG